MKTKARTKQLKQARQNKQAAKVSTKKAVFELTATGIFLALLSVAIYIQF